jgi:CelD/BcsL family acetyltransferase involved in cellulose biosynthesis
MNSGNERVEWLDDAGFAAVQAQWERLASGHPTPFCDHAWFTAWWAAFGRGRLCACTVWRSDELVGGLPLCEHQGVLRALSNYHTPELAPLALDASARLALVRAVYDRRPGTLCLHGVPMDGPVTAEFRSESRRRRRLWRAEPAHLSPLVNTASGGFEAFLAARRGGVRTLLRRRRKLHRETNATLRFEAAPDDLDSALSAGFVVEGSGWKTRQASAILSSPQTEGFYRSIAHIYRSRDELRLGFLDIEGCAAAFNLMLLSRRRLWLLKTGFDPAFQRFTPGLVLNLDAVERAFALGLEAYELLGADEQWKQLFATGSRAHSRLWSYKPTPGPAIRFAARGAVGTVRRTNAFLAQQRPRARA